MGLHFSAGKKHLVDSHTCGSEWDEAQRLDFLLKELKGKRPLLPPGLAMEDEVAAVINCFKVSAGRAGLGMHVRVPMFSSLGLLLHWACNQRAAMA